MESTIKNTELKKRAVKSTAILFSKHLISFLVNFIGGVILARYYGPVIMGLYFVSYTVFVISRELIDWGTQISFISHENTPDENEIRTAFTAQQIIGACLLVITTIVIAPLSRYIYKDGRIYALVLSAVLGAYLFSLIRIPVAMYEREMNYIKISVIEVSEIVFFNFVAIIMLALSYNITALVWGNVARGLAPAIIALIYKKKLPALITDFSLLKQYYISNFPILGSNFSVWLMIMAPPILVGSIAGPAALGISQIAYTALNQTTILSTILNRVFLVFLSKMQNDIKMLENYINKIFQAVSVVYIVLIFGVSCLSSFWVPLIYGNKWTGVENIMILGALPVAQTAVLLVFSSALFAVGKSKIAFYQYIISAFLYWMTMLIFVLLGFKEYSIPIANLVAAQSGIMMLYYIHKNIGKIKWIGASILFYSCYALSVAIWFLLKYSFYEYAFLGVIGFIIIITLYMRNKKQTYVNIMSLVMNRV
jgi:PST family polysaccharide transporter